MKTFQISRHYLAVVALLSGANSYVTASGAEPISTDSTTRNEAAIGRTLSESISSAISQISLRSHRDDIPAADGPPASCMIRDDTLFWPFCKPTNGSHLYVDKTYSITWDPSAIKATDSVIVSLNYHEARPSIRTSSFAAVSDNGAWTSPKQPLSRSSITVTMSPDWLQGHIRNDLFVSVSLLNSSSTPDSPYPRATKIRGPSVTLTKKPVRQRPPHVSQLCKMGLVIGLPVGLVVALAVIALACVCMSRRNRLVICAAARGYGERQSRLNRLGIDGGGVSWLRRDRGKGCWRAQQQEEIQLYESEDSSLNYSDNLQSNPSLKYAVD